MLIDLRNKNLTGKKAQETLDKAHITLIKMLFLLMINHRLLLQVSV